MTPEERQEMGAAMRRIAHDTFRAGFVLGRKLMVERLEGVEPLKMEHEEALAESTFMWYESKLQGIYGRLN